MTTKQILKKLLAVKVEVSQLGMKNIQSKLPISISDAAKEMEPFTNIENAIEAEIQKLKNPTLQNVKA